jgi:hypothetical protein
MAGGAAVTGERCTLHSFADCPLCWRLEQERLLFREGELLQGRLLRQVLSMPQREGNLWAGSL